jgi:hypothetical protein
LHGQASQWRKASVTFWAISDDLADVGRRFHRPTHAVQAALGKIRNASADRSGPASQASYLPRVRNQKGTVLFYTFGSVARRRRVELHWYITDRALQLAAAREFQTLLEFQIHADRPLEEILHGLDQSVRMVGSPRAIGHDAHHDPIEQSLDDLALVMTTHLVDGIDEDRRVFLAIGPYPQRGAALPLHPGEEWQASFTLAAFRAEGDLVADVVADEGSAEIMQHGQDHSAGFPRLTRSIGFV